MSRYTGGNRVRYVLLLALLAVGAGPARAHTDAWFDTNPTPHGGQVRMSGQYHLELVVAEDALRVYVTDHADNGIATAGWTGQIIVLAGGQKRALELKPAGDNLLQAAARFADLPDLKAVVTLRPPAGEEYAARFAPGPRKPAVPAAAPQNTPPAATP